MGVCYGLFAGQEPIASSWVNVRSLQCTARSKPASQQHLRSSALQTLAAAKVIVWPLQCTAGSEHASQQQQRGSHPGCVPVLLVQGVLEAQAPPFDSWPPCCVPGTRPAWLQSGLRLQQSACAVASATSHHSRSSGALSAQPCLHHAKTVISPSTRPSTIKFS